LTDAFDVDVVWLAFARTAIAGPVFLVISLIVDNQRTRALLHDAPMLVRAIIFAIVGVAFIQIAYMSAVKYLGAGNALLLQETGLILIVAYTCIRTLRLPTRRELLALALALFGTAAIATQGNIGSLEIGAVGLAWGLAAGVALAGYNIVPGSLLQKYGSLVTNGYSMTIAAILLAPFARPWEAQATPQMTPTGWLVFAAVVAVGTILAYIVYLQGVKEAGPVKASLIAVFEPVSGMLFSLVWLGEGITPADLVGCAAIVAMMVAVTLPAKPRA
jgi:drug/metabolite transporter (DMT)-like permease